MNQRFRRIAGPPCGARLEKLGTALAWMDDDLGDMELLVFPLLLVVVVVMVVVLIF